MNVEEPTEESLPPQRRPCPFCGHLVADRAEQCDRCKLALDKKTLRGLRKRLGPWFLLDPKNPSAPGVNWEKFLSLIERGKVAGGSVVRGPATGGLWRFARDAPSVATRLGMCWSCHAELPDRESKRCPRCRRVLNGPKERPRGRKRLPVPQELPSPSALDDLAQAARPADGAGAGASARAAATRVGAFVSMLALLAGAAASLWIFWSVFRIVSDLRREEGPVHERRLSPQQSGEREIPTDRPAREGHLPGELFPDVPYEASSPRQPASAPAGDKLSPEELTRQRRWAEALFEKARALEQQGDLRAAREALFKLLNNHHPDAWPEGAVAAFKRVQRAVGTGTRPSFFGSEAP